MTIKHDNIVFMPTISELGGIETYVYEMVKKYKDLDIAVVSNSCDKLQEERIRKYCKLYIHTDEKIECKVALISYDTSIIKYINEDAKIYEVIHADFSNPIYNGKKPPKNDRITDYIAITNFLKDKMQELLKVDNMIMSYNPLTIEEEEPCLTLVSATRLHKAKGKHRMEKLAKALDAAGVSYVWYVFTNEEKGIDSPNVIFLKNRLDTGKWLSKADYGVLLSDSEACSYFINETLYRNIPIICTPLPYLKEIGVEDGKNSYIMKFDCSNVDDIVRKIKNVPKFKFEQLKDRYREILAPGKSHYEEDKSKKVWVKCIKTRGYDDIQLGKFIEYNAEYVIKLERAEYLERNKVVKIIKEYKPSKKIK